MAIAPAYEKGKLYQVPITDLTPDPAQPRKVIDPEALQRLMDEQNFTQEQLGGIVGKARTTVRDILTINKLPQSIRDECRGDRTMTRQTLIDIARKKQERGMITAYNAYRLKQQKAKESEGQKPDQPPGKNSNDPAAVLEFTQKVVKKIGNINTKAWTSDERESICAAFTDIKNKIDIFLNPKPKPS